MPTLKVPLFGPVYQNVNGIELNDKTAELYDGYTNEENTTVKRPGLHRAGVIGSSPSYPIDSIAYLPKVDKNLLTCGGKIFSFDSDGTETDCTGSVAINQARATYATDGTSCFVAHGGKIQQATLPGTFSEISDSPSAVSHVAWLDGYLLANSVGSSQWYSSAVNDPDNFTDGDLWNALGNPDPVVGLYVLNRQIFLFGTQSLEIWENNGVTPFEQRPRLSHGVLEEPSPYVDSRQRGAGQCGAALGAARGHQPALDLRLAGSTPKAENDTNDEPPSYGPPRRGKRRPP